MLDGCQYDEDVSSIQSMLTANFLRFYQSSTKPPLPLAYHAAWFRQRPHREVAFHKFLDSILQLPDVYMVTNQAALQWMRAPTPLPGPQPALCSSGALPPPCGRARRRCSDRNDPQGRGFHTCAETCPVECLRKHHLG